MISRFLAFLKLCIFPTSSNIYFILCDVHSESSMSTCTYSDSLFIWVIAELCDWESPCWYLNFYLYHSCCPDVQLGRHSCNEQQQYYYPANWLLHVQEVTALISLEIHVLYLCLFFIAQTPPKSFPQVFFRLQDDSELWVISLAHCFPSTHTRSPFILPTFLFWSGLVFFFFDWSSKALIIGYIIF